ncbi:hypothetical protein RJ639_029015 [Escallonia herrerae]|uniref:Uncharacterized protein n=1 Tax=Escallonia herrerae TaxID=1293975 RepID=A0AA88X6S5_9ASTE|nr:hypothetical protein RJ639_029015 [Escallonia herrerae]
MKATTLTPLSSVKSTTTNDGGGSCSSWQGCQRDANCKCDICLDSINATLDLIPTSYNKSSITKFSATKPVSRSPVSFNILEFSPPEMGSRRIPVSPPFSFTARMGILERMKMKKRDFGLGVMTMLLVLVLGLVLLADFGGSGVVGRVLRPKFSLDLVRNLGAKSWVLPTLNGKMKYLEKELQGLVGGKVSNSSSLDPKWKVVQDGLLLNSRCTLYKSAVEEVSVWGWPLQTAGLLTAEFSSRSFTILSGRVTEWSNGEARYLIRKANSSWAQGKWSASLVHFDRNTWILEYRRSSVLENARLLSAVLQFLKFRMIREVQKMKQEFWLLSAFGKENIDLTEDSFRVPT